MFNFRSSKVEVEVAPFIRRIVDLTTPDRPVAEDCRLDRRYNRTLPVVLCPALNGTPNLRESVMALTQDLCDRGIGLTTLEPIPEGEYYVSIWPNNSEQQEPVHFRCDARDSRQIAHGFWATGMQILEVMNANGRFETGGLTKLAQRALREYQPQPETATV